jgi:Transcription factor WhiB
MTFSALQKPGAPTFGEQSMNPDVEFGTGGSDQSGSRFWLDALVSEVPRFDQAACAETDPEVFFPVDNGSHLPAKAICGSCVERCRCLAWALESGQQFGIYGGMTPHERRRLLMRRRAA